MITIKNSVGRLYGQIVEESDWEKSVNFVTPPKNNLQVATMQRPISTIEPHVHKETARNVVGTQEVLIILEGSMRVTFFEVDGDFLASHIVGKGQVIVLIAGGHSFEILSPLKMVEVKQGPYGGPFEKQRIQPQNVPDKTETQPLLQETSHDETEV